MTLKRGARGPRGAGKGQFVHAACVCVLKDVNKVKGSAQRLNAERGLNDMSGCRNIPVIVPDGCTC